MTKQNIKHIECVRNGITAKCVSIAWHQLGYRRDKNWRKIHKQRRLRAISCRKKYNSIIKENR